MAFPQVTSLVIIELPEVSGLLQEQRPGSQCLESLVYPITRPPDKERFVRSLLTEFRQFILRGNVVDLAVGIVVGVAFTGVVQSLVSELINPLIAMLFGKPNFS